MGSEAMEMGASIGNFAYHLRIGVSGHRNLKDPAKVKRAVENVLDHLDNTLQPQSRTPLQWTVISPLAKGADRIVADAVLTHGPARLEVLSPFQLDEYRRDFEKGEDRDGFERLLAKADSVHCASAGVPDEQANAETQTKSRNRGYLAVGRSVVDACELLIVIWDGQPANGTGGTGDVVRYALQQQRTVIWVPANESDREPRLLVDWQPGEQPQIQELPTIIKELSLGYHQLDAYHRDRAVGSEQLAESISGASASLRKQADEAGLSQEAIEPVIDKIVPHYVRADQLAVFYRNRYVYATTGLFLLSAIAVTIVVGQILFFPSVLWLILFEIMAMGMAVGLWWWSKRAAWHEKWIHDRYLAERLRMASFALLVDRTELATAVAPSQTFAFYSGPRDWLLWAVRDVVEEIRAAEPISIDLPILKRFMIDAWLDDQRRYHASNYHRKHAAVHRGHRLGTTLFLLTLIMAVLHLFGVGHSEGHHGAGIARLDAWITFFAIVLPVWGAAAHAITTQLELERIATRSERMAAVLGRLVQQAREAETFAEIREIAEEGQRVMSTENHEWWILLSFRQPVLPT